MTDHEHVTLDEAVYYAYQELAHYVRQIIEGRGDVNDLPFWVYRLDTALDASHAECERDPGHHRGEGKR